MVETLAPSGSLDELQPPTTTTASTSTAHRPREAGILRILLGAAPPSCRFSIVKSFAVPRPGIGA